MKLVMNSVLFLFRLSVMGLTKTDCDFLIGKVQLLVRDSSTAVQH